MVIGFFLMDWSLGVLPKYLVLAVTSFTIIMTLYELLIKRFNGLRFLFGLKSRQPASTAPTTRLEEKAI